MACGLRDVAVQAARANWADSLSSRMLRAAVGLHGTDCVFLWQCGIRADEDIANAPTLP